MRDVMPDIDDNTSITDKPVKAYSPSDDPSPVGSLESTPDKPKKPKSLFQKVAGLVKSDTGIVKLHAEDDKELAELTRHQAERQQKAVEIEQGILERAKRADPDHQAEIKRQEAEYKSKLREASRLSVLIEMADEKLKRNKPDEKLVQWCFGILQNHNLFGIMSKPAGK